MNQVEYVAQAVRDRGQMFQGIEVAAQEAIKALVPLFKQDFQHQRVVRGLSRESSIDEVDGNIDRYLIAIKARIREQVWAELNSEGALYGGL